VIVVDTNVVAYLWLPGERTGEAEAVLRKDPEWAVPFLWRSELRSVLAGWLRKGLLGLPAASRIAAGAEAQLRRREFAVASDAVLGLVAGSRCSAYDCEFVALAEELRVPLVTSDREVLRAFPRVAVSPGRFLRG